jgi:hypothetical protein
MEKYGKPREATDGNIIRRVRILCWITKATDTHTQNMQYLLLSHGKSGYANAPQCYVTRSLPVLLNVNRVDGTDIGHWALSG